MYNGRENIKGNKFNPHKKKIHGPKQTNFTATNKKKFAFSLEKHK
jgi:hypothetical protein